MVRRLRRVAVITSASGNGATTFAREAAARLRVPLHELDALNHGPGWAEATPEELRARVVPIVARDAWVIDGGYQSKLGELVIAGADLVVWLDLPMRVWLPRLLRRSLRRITRGELLWNGNRETVRGVFLGRDALVPWALRQHRRRRHEYPRRLAPFPHVRLRSTREVERFLRAL